MRIIGIRTQGEMNSKIYLDNLVKNMVELKQ